MSRFDYAPFKQAIEKHSKIIVLGHKAPDYDSFSSQLGMFLGLRNTYPNKVVLAGGECKNDDYLSYYTDLTEDDYIDALVIFTDTPSPTMVCDDGYKKASYVVVIDHHFSRGDFGDLSFVDTTLISAALLVVDILEDFDIEIDEEMAKIIIYGIITDSGRFRYKNTDTDTFRVVSMLLAKGAVLQDVYSVIYSQSLDFVRHKGYVMSHFKVHNNRIGYIIHTKDLIEQSKLSMFEVTRGMVNTMADIEGIDAWANFTVTDEGVKAEFRSKKIPVVSVAKDFGGGGHELACGATIKDLDVVNDCLEALSKVLEAY